MIEIYRKGFRLDIPTTQIVTFKKAQNLNGVQDRYSYSNTMSLAKTANNKKLLDLTDLPMGKAQTMQNGYQVDIVLNGSIQLRNQTLKITKETKDKVDLYLLYADSDIVSRLKNLYINDVVKDIKYKKTRSEFARLAFADYNPLAPAVFVQTQPVSGLYVVEEMPLLINLQWLIYKMFLDIGYAMHGDFASTVTTVKDYYVAPNQGIYQIYSGTGDGFSPAFDTNLTAFDLLNQTLAYFNCYATPDDTNRNVIINHWSNLGNYKDTFKDYSRFFVDYKDFAFQSRLAKRNNLTYSDSGDTFNSYFNNSLSSEIEATYLASKFGSGSTNIFDDSEINEDNTIAVRANGELGETSAIRIYKIQQGLSNLIVYEDGLPGGSGVEARRAIPVSMREVYNEFHQAYTDFILTPLIQNVIFRYDEILAKDFSMTEVFFIEQLASYWIPLEINFSTTKDRIDVRAMLIKARKVVSPILNNFNAVLLDFRQRVIFPVEYLLSMYPIPPNEHEWDQVIFKSYDQTKNALYVNGVLVPANSLPQVFPIAGITIEFEADLPGATIPNTLTDSLYIQAIDTNGGISNDAYITLKHTGVANLESNFKQMTDYLWEGTNLDNAGFRLNVLEYTTGLRPNLNNTITSLVPGVIDGSGTLVANDSFNAIVTSEPYGATLVTIPPFVLTLITENMGTARAQLTVRVIIAYGGIVDGGNNGIVDTVREYNSTDNQAQTIIVPQLSYGIPALANGDKIRIYFWIEAKNAAFAQPGSINATVGIRTLQASISTTKTY